MNQPAREVVDRLHAGLEIALDAPSEASDQDPDPRQQLVAGRARELRGCGRGRRPHVRREVGDREVGLVPDADHDRNRRGADRARDPLVVESAQVLDAAAAAAQDQHVALGASSRGGERFDDLGRRRFALDGGRVDDHRDRRVAPPQRRQDVPQRCSGLRSDHADRARVGGQRPLRRRIEQTLALELVAQAQESLVQGAEPRRTHELDVQLEVAARLVERDQRPHLDLHPVARLPVEEHAAAAKHDAPHLSRAVLQGEVEMTRAGLQEVRDLAGDPGERQAMLEEIADAPIERGNAEDRTCRNLAFPRQRWISGHFGILTYPQAPTGPHRPHRTREVPLGRIA